MSGSGKTRMITLLWHFECPHATKLQTKSFMYFSDAKSIRSDD